MMTEIKIKNKKISENWPVFFIAEIGINHNGDVELAKKLIDIACLCGCDAVKFQKRTPDLCVPDKQKNAPKSTPWGEMTYLDYKKKMEFGEEQYSIIDKYCRSKKMIWFASPWDVPSVDFLETFNVPCYKVPSAMLTSTSLLKAVKATDKPVLLSTGMSTLTQVDTAVKFFEGCPLVILHCNSSYPSESSELNLSVTTAYKTRYPEHIIGYSGHEKGYTASLIAAVLGARVIERHITLDRAMWGSDHAASLEFDAVRRLVRDLKLLPLWIGDGHKKVYDSEQNIMKKLRPE
jgi:N-acetylneuraminate synthase